MENLTEIGSGEKISESIGTNRIAGSNWPVSEGRYEVGDESSPVAVCTMASVDLKLPMGKIAILGKCVTENIGIEKIVKNIVSNPKIRFLIMCGKISKGHFVEQAIESLIENGVDDQMNIIGAKGAMPSVKNLTKEDVEKFKKQVILINIAGEEEHEKILDVVKACYQKNPGVFEYSNENEIIKEVNEMEGEEIKAAEAEVAAMNIGSIRADASLLSWKQDEKGFFIICPDSHRNEIIVEYHAHDGKILGTIIGINAEEIFKTIIAKNLVSEKPHCAYLGAELIKAEIAMKNKLDYIQDSELIIPTKVEKRSEIRIHGHNMEKKTYMTKNEKNSPVFIEKVDHDEDLKKVLQEIGMCRVF
ncbi:MAG: tetrahydromethanopterin S-methyltransferase subunit A [Nanoarchaeota archaeon]